MTGSIIQSDFHSPSKSIDNIRKIINMGVNDLFEIKYSLYGSYKETKGEYEGKENH